MSLDGQLLGRYRLTRLLGSGGMGDVYLAEDSQDQRQIAIKVIRSETSYRGNDATNEVERLFHREAKAIAKLDHPRILSVYDYGEKQLNNLTLFYFVMPYCSDGSLADWLRRQGGTVRLTTQDVVHIVQQAAEALQHAHDHYVIHQDIKPSNFLVQSYVEGSTCPDLVLSDFGIARFANATSSASQSIRGTPTYMAPEQWEGNPAYATDQYGLAVMAFELLTGQPPFQGNVTRMMYQHLNVEPPLATSINPTLSPQIDFVLLHALEKRPEQRFPTITALSEAFAMAAVGALPEQVVASLLPAKARKDEQKVRQASPASIEPHVENSIRANNSSTQSDSSAESTFLKAAAINFSAEQVTEPANAPRMQSPSSGHLTTNSRQSTQPNKNGRVRRSLLTILVLVILAGSAVSIFVSIRANQTIIDTGATATTETENAATTIALTNANATRFANRAATVQSNDNATATAVANVNSTVQAHNNATSTAIANLNATAIAQANNNATATAIANDNATATAAAMPTTSPAFSCSTASDCVGPATFHNCGTDWVHIGADSYTASNGSTSCNSAIWDDHALTLYHTCRYYVLVPSDPGYNSTATLYLGFFDQNNNTMVIISLNESLVAPNHWAYVGTESDVHHVNLGDNNGQTNTVIGISTMGYQCQ
jgi:serine/threonine protein kinase